MAKAELKTKKNEFSVEDFLEEIADEDVRADCRKISAMMETAAGAPPKMWGASIVGFGIQRIKSDAGREADWMEIGFSPRKANLTLYLNSGDGWDEVLLSKLGKHKTGKGCLYFKKLSDVDKNVLDELVGKSIENIRSKAEK